MRNYLLRTFCIAAISATACADALAAIADGDEFYIQSDYYDMVLGLNADGTTPRLSAYGTNSDTLTYVMVAEASETDGYYYIRNKGTGKYLSASTSNTWSVLWTDEKASGNAGLWKFDVQAGREIVSRQNTSKRLGCDWSEESYVGVYYDKARNSMTRFSVIPVAEGGFAASRATFETDVFTNEQGVSERDVWQVNSAVTLTDTVDLHLVSDEPFATTGSIDIRNHAAWVVFENVRPSTVISTYLSHITVNGQAAVSGENVRVAIWLDGAAVIPYVSTETVFRGYTEANFGGEELKLSLKEYATLNNWRNRLRSFTLRRGNMAVVATSTGSGGYTRVYVADHGDLRIDTLPDALNLRISSVCIKPWQYTSKKGWCSTQSNSGIASGTAKMEATWFYTWSADRSSTSDCEYVPMQPHLYWPSVSDITSRTASLNMLSFNEPEHSEQHESADCSCGGTISSWTACTKMPSYTATNMRIGSPGPTDSSWLTEFTGHVDDMAYRCDFVAIHAYWGANEVDGASAWYNKLKAIHDATGRPIWITEWAYGASWTTESWPSGYSDQLEQNRERTSEIVDMLERQPWIERYSYYQWDTSSRRFINDDGWVTPAGRMYRDTKSTFSYNADYQKVPNWWKPSTKTPTATATLPDASDGDVVFKIANPNGDCASTLQLQRYNEETASWETLCEVTDRYLFDDDTVSFSLPLSEIDRFNDRFRVAATTLFGGAATSTEFDLGYIRNPDANEELEGWTVSNLSTNTGEASDGEAQNVYWNQWKANGLSSSMTQTVMGLPAGDYVVSALLRGGSNVTLTLQAMPGDSIPGTESASLSGVGSATQEGSDYQYGWMLVTLPAITLAEGETLTITATGEGEGSAWWSADHFHLDYTPAVPDIPDEPDAIQRMGADGAEDDAQPVFDLSGRPASPQRHGIVIRAGRKILH